MGCNNGPSGRYQSSAIRIVPIMNRYTFSFAPMGIDLERRRQRPAHKGHRGQHHVCEARAAAGLLRLAHAVGVAGVGGAKICECH